MSLLRRLDRGSGPGLQYSDFGAGIQKIRRVACSDPARNGQLTGKGAVVPQDRRHLQVNLPVG